MKNAVPLGRAALSLAAVLATLPVAEGVLRRVAPARTPLYAPDPRAVYRLRPGAEDTFHAGAQAVRFHVNSLGYRGPELQASPAVRILVYGDSFVEARLTPLEATFAERLHALLGDAGGRSVEAVNAGVSGYGPDQVALRMEDELSRLRPQVVVLVLFAGNDGGDLVRNGLFRIEAGRLAAVEWTLDDHLAPRLFAPRGWRGLALVRAAGRAWRMARDRLAAADGPPRGSIEWALAECAHEHERALDRNGRVGELFIDHYDADLSVQPRSASALYKRSLMRAVLERIRDTAARAGVPLLAVVVPAPNDVCPGFPGRVDPVRYPDYRPSTLTDGLQEILAAHGIPFVNLFETFRAGGDRFYHPRDGHWNAEGQDVAAREAAAYVLSAGWIR